MRTLITPLFMLLIVGLSVVGGFANWKIFNPDTDLQEPGFYTSRNGLTRANSCRSVRPSDEVAYLIPPPTAGDAGDGTNTIAATTNAVAALPTNAVNLATGSNAVVAATNLPPIAASNAVPVASTNQAPVPSPTEPINVDQEALAIEEGLNLTAFEEVDILRKDPLTVIFDARTKGEYKDGHIPGAISIPFEFASRKKHNKTLEEKTEGFSRPTIIYCGDKFCPKARELGNYLRDLGQSELLIFVGGWHDWSENGGEVAQ